MRVIMLVVCMVILTPCQLEAKSAHHRSTYCTTCARDSHGPPKGCQVDHVVPLSKGGKDTLANMQLLP
jgi:5-methylcytosine-specific restriction endonuclease McrA